MDLIFHLVLELLKKVQNIEKREKVRLLLLFLNNNDPFVLHPALCISYFGPDYFSGSQTDPCFQKKNSGCRMQIDWATCTLYPESVDKPDIF